MGNHQEEGGSLKDAVDDGGVNGRVHSSEDGVYGGSSGSTRDVGRAVLGENRAEPQEDMGFRHFVRGGWGAVPVDRRNMEVQLVRGGEEGGWRGPERVIHQGSGSDVGW